jgi:hypothetical protein
MLRRLADAVRNASDYDETRWIAWKSNLDLTSDHGQLHMIKQILGFANRDPSVAKRWAEGHAYLLVGVDPRRLKGVTAVDTQTLSQNLKPYIGASAGVGLGVDGRPGRTRSAADGARRGDGPRAGHRAG